jgi:toxin ParE1/3/4
MAHRLAPQAVEDLDSIWFYIATESASIEAANRLIDSFTRRFLLLAQHPYIGRVRDEDFGPGSRSFAVGEYVVIYRVHQPNVLILRVVHGHRDLAAWFLES